MTDSSFIGSLINYRVFNLMSTINYAGPFKEEAGIFIGQRAFHRVLPKMAILTL